MDHAIPTPALGFSIRFRLSDGLGEDGALELWDDFVAGPLGGRGLTCDTSATLAPPDGAGTSALTRLLYRPNATTTEDDRRAVREWARRRGEIADYDVGPLTSLTRA
jgi:hypothetical protein